MDCKRVNHINIEITNHCNFNCTFCPNSIMKRKRGFMPKELFKKTINEIAQYQLADYISYHIMGEPLLHPDFLEMLQYACEKQQKNHLITNVSLIGDTMIEPILKNVTLLEMSLQSYDDESFAQRRAKKLDYEGFVNLIQNIIRRKFAMDSGTRIKLSLIENSVNVMKDFPQEIKLLDSNEKLESLLCRYWNGFFREISQEFHVPLLEPLEIKFKGFQHEFLPGISLVTRWATNWGNSITASPKVYPAMFAKCNGCIDQLGILWNGDVVPCCVDYEGKIVMGNCGRSGLYEIMNSEYYRKIADGFHRGILIHDHCKRCRGGTTLISWLAIQMYSFVKFRYL